jgi:hypothetical protein
MPFVLQRNKAGFIVYWNKGITLSGKLDVTICSTRWDGMCKLRMDLDGEMLICLGAGLKVDWKWNDMRGM